MVPFITLQIEKKAKISLEEGQNKYRAYFVKTNRYEQFKEDVDTNLRVDGFEEVIVTE